MAQELKPDIAILDISMPELNGVDAAERIRKESPKTEILILSMHYSDQLIRDILEAGVRGYIVKSDSDRDLVIAVETLANHKPFLHAARHRSDADELQSRHECVRSFPETLRDRLTSREREIVQLLAEGKSSKEVATTLEHQREDSRNAPRQHHAKTAAAHRKRAGSIRGAEPNRRGVVVLFLRTRGADVNLSFPAEEVSQAFFLRVIDVEPVGNLSPSLLRRAWHRLQEVS